MRPSIIFLIPYFGQWPFWMPFFLESCKANPDIDWLLLGDCGRPFGLPPNVNYQYVEFADYCRWISERLGLTFAPTSPYKLCDLKPAFGYLHEQDISGYDFWGFSDLDLIYGNLRRYFADARLGRYKLLSTHDRRVSGHLCLLRNERPLRELFWRIPDFKKRVQEPTHHGLDEGGFSRIFLWRKNFPKPLFEMLGMFNSWRRSSEFTEAFSTPNVGRPWLDGTYRFPKSWYWQDGRLSNDLNKGREFPYLHFLGWKKTAWRTCAQPDAQTLQQIAGTLQWRIDEKGFHFAENRDGC